MVVEPVDADVSPGTEAVFTVQVRNKLVQAYQDVMRMPV